MVEVKIHGLREIRAAMLALPRRIDRKILNEGLLDGAKLVRDEARARAPVLRAPHSRRKPGVLRRAVQAIRVRPDRFTATVLVRVRPLSRGAIRRFKQKAMKRGLTNVTGADNPNDPFYWRFVEFGTSKMPAKPFLRPAFESRKTLAVKMAVQTFRRRVAEEIGKLGAAARVR